MSGIKNAVPGDWKQRLLAILAGPGVTEPKAGGLLGILGSFLRFMGLAAR